jgi:hypothetical protein
MCEQFALRTPFPPLRKTSIQPALSLTDLRPEEVLPIQVFLFLFILRHAPSPLRLRSGQARLWRDKKERPPSTWSSAALAQRLLVVSLSTRLRRFRKLVPTSRDSDPATPRQARGRQCVTFIRIQPLRSAALNGIRKTSL